MGKRKVRWKLWTATLLLVAGLWVGFGVYQRHRLDEQGQKIAANAVAWLNQQYATLPVGQEATFSTPVSGCDQVVYIGPYTSANTVKATCPELGQSTARQLASWASDAKEPAFVFLRNGNIRGSAELKGFKLALNAECFRWSVRDNTLSVVVKKTSNAQFSGGELVFVSGRAGAASRPN